MGSHSSAPTESIHSMAVFSAMLVGTVCGMCVLGTTLLSLIRNQPKEKSSGGRRESMSVTEILQVDMVDHRIRMTSIDCNLNMELDLSSKCNNSEVLSSITGVKITQIL